MVTTAYIEHRIPGRIRLRIPERRGDVAFFERVVGALSKLADVEVLDASPVTGSVRICHSGTGEAITAAAEEKGLFRVGAPVTDAEPKKRAALEKSDAGAPQMLDSMATGLSGLALFQVIQGQLTGSAGENFWHSYGAQRVLGNPALATGFALLGIYQLLQGQWLGSASSLLFYALAARQLAAFDRAAAAMTGRGGPAKSPEEPPKPKPPAPKRAAQKAPKKSGVSG